MINVHIYPVRLKDKMSYFMYCKMLLSLCDELLIVYVLISKYN